MNPVETYRFVSPRREYRYTSYATDVSALDDVNGSQLRQTYTALPIQRNELEIVSQDSDPALELTLPYDAELIQDFAYGPGDRALTLTFRRYAGVNNGQVIEDANNPPQVLWQGDVTSTVVEELEGKVRAPSSLGARLAAPIPSVYYQTQCNHVLYGSTNNGQGGCRVDPNQAVTMNGNTIPFFFILRTTALSEDGLFLTVELGELKDLPKDTTNRALIDAAAALNPFETLPTHANFFAFDPANFIPYIPENLSANPPTREEFWLKGGEITHLRSGEKRLIVAHGSAINNGNLSPDGAHNIVRLNYEFLDIGVGHLFLALAGCNHRISTCKEKFNNIANFGGHPTIPLANLFRDGIDQCG